MTGVAWLQEQLDRALLAGDPARHPELLGAIEALRAVGAVCAEDAVAAEVRLRGAFEPAGVPRVDEGSTVAPDEQLRAVLAPAAGFVGLRDGVLMLVTLELWSASVIMRLAVAGSHATRHERSATVAWVVRGSAYDGPGLLAPPILRDDFDTVYTHVGAYSADGRPAEHHVTPGVPPAASRLTVSVHLERGAKGELTVDVSAH